MKKIFSYTCWKKLMQDLVYEGIYREAGIIDTKGARKSWRRIANRVLTNLYEQPDRVVYSRDRNAYAPGSYFYYEKVGYKPMMLVINKLREAGFIDNYPGSRNKGEGELFSSFAPTRKLLDIFDGISLESSQIYSKPTFPVILRDYPTRTKYKNKDGNTKIKRQTGKTLPVDCTNPRVKALVAPVLEIMKRYNAEMDNHELTWAAPYSVQQVYASTGKRLYPDTGNKYMVATFTGDLESGGRMYQGVWVNMPKLYRPWLKLDGEFLWDVDLVACHIDLLYRKKDLEMPSNPYLYFKSNPDTKDKRDDAKKLLLTMVNYTPNKTKTGKDYSPDAVRNHVVNGSKLLDGYKGQEWRDRKQELLDLLYRLERHHTPIKDSFYSGLGLKLQNDESNIMRSVMTRCLNQGIIILPVHDGCMVKGSQVGALIQIFDEMGYRVDGEELVRDEEAVDQEVKVHMKEYKRLGESIMVNPDSEPRPRNRGQNSTGNQGMDNLLEDKISGVITNIDPDTIIRTEVSSESFIHKQTVSLKSHSDNDSERFKGKFKRAPEFRFKLSSIPEKRIAGIPEILTKDEQDKMESRYYYWCLIGFSNEPVLMHKRYQGQKIKTIKEHNDSVLMGEDGKYQGVFGCWDTALADTTEVVCLPRDDFYWDGTGSIVKYVHEDGTIRLQYSNHPDIRAYQKISRATKQEFKDYYRGLPLTMTEHISPHEPVRYAKWGYSKAEGIPIEQWPGDLKSA